MAGIVKLFASSEKSPVSVLSGGQLSDVSGPLTKCVSSFLAVGCCGHLMAAGSEQVGGFIMDGQEALRLAGRFEPALYFLSFPRRSV